jgi:hypothetical protein
VKPRHDLLEIDCVSTTILPSTEYVCPQISWAARATSTLQDDRYFWPVQAYTPRSQVRKGSNTSSRVFEVDGIVGVEEKVKALGDYCAKHNFMKTSYAEYLDLEVDQNAVRTIVIGSGKEVRTTGTVVVRFRFSSEPEVYSLTFHLIPSCIHNVVLGKPFLKATQTFSSAANFLRRVLKRFVVDFQSFDCMYLGDSAPSFIGRLNGQAQHALADSGSKVLIMDEKYAQSLGLPIIDDRQHRIKLRFADNSTAMTTGMTLGVRWQFGPDGGAKEHLLDFHILKNAPAAVILIDDFLFGETRAFAEYHCYLVDEDDEDEDAQFFAIDIDLNYYHEAEHH